jgi:hypothetical protein
MVRDFSYRLTKMHEKLLTEYLRWRLKGRVTTLLADYRSRNISLGPPGRVVRPHAGARNDRV